MSTAPDWGLGAYEQFAPALEAAAAHLVRVAAPLAGERAVDLGCGTGNATLPLAAAGAQVTAVDPSLRLLGVASERARAAGHRITALAAGAENLPLPGADADLVVSNFGVIFATDPPAALDEVLRVLTPAGRFVFTAWKPTGPIADVGRLMREATTGGGAASPVRDPDARGQLAWHDPTTYAELIPGGMEAVVVHDAETDFVAASAEAWLHAQTTSHPMWLAARGHIADDAVWAQVTEDSIRVLEAGSFGVGEFRVRSPYVVVEAHPRR